MYYYRAKKEDMKELEELDIRILRELLRDGRKSFTAIARECQTSNDAICAHYKELKKTGVIVGATIQFNYQKLGYSGVAMVMINVEASSKEKVFECLENIPEILVTRNYNSVYIIGALSKLKSLSDLERVKQLINRQNKINGFKTYLWLDVRNIPENILPGSDEDPSQHAYSPMNTAEDPLSIDEVDTQIMDALTKNGRLPFSKIAEQIGSSTATITRRYERLKENNYIKVSVQINPLKLGFQSILDVNVALEDQSKIDEIANKISGIRGVSYIVKISGNYDLSVAALVKDCNDVIDVNNQILAIANIKKIEGTLRKLQSAWPGSRQYISTF